MATDDRKDPFRGYNFKVVIDGITRAGFREVSGLDTTQDVVEYREGTSGNNLYSKKLYGLAKTANIVLKWGITTDDEIWKWRQAVVTGDPKARKNCSVTIIDEEGKEHQSWNLAEAWPCKWTGPTLNATSNEVAIETLEIAHEGIEWKGK